jgi:hypothetical protein
MRTYVPPNEYNSSSSSSSNKVDLELALSDVESK